MAYSLSTQGSSYTLAPCLQTLANQIAASPRYGPACANLGWVPDASHVAQGSDSDHNPWLFGMVRAIDIGGPTDLLVELRDWLNRLYAAKDHRIWREGYTNGPTGPDDLSLGSYGTDWDHPGQLHVLGGDDRGHLHISASRDLAGCNDTTPWPLPDSPLTPAPQEDDNMKYRLISRRNKDAPDTPKDTQIYAYNNCGLFWPLPGPAWVPVALDDPDCLSTAGDIEVPSARFDFLHSMAIEASVPSDRLGAALKALPAETASLVPAAQVDAGAVKAAAKTGAAEALSTLNLVQKGAS